MGPILTRIKNWLVPEEPTPPAPEPTPEPSPAPAPVTPVVPDVKPSSIDVINYVRVLSVLRKIDIAKLRTELAKIPQLGPGICILMWCALTYWLITTVMSLFR